VKEEEGRRGRDTCERRGGRRGRATGERRGGGEVETQLKAEKGAER